MNMPWLKRRQTSQVIRPPVAPASLPAAPTGRAAVKAHPAFTQDALQRAWRQVKSSGGGPGVDGVDLQTFESELNRHLGSLQVGLSDGSYRPLAVRRVLIPKHGDGLRPLAIWTLRDRVAQRAVYNAVEPLFEPHFLDCSHGFRSGRSTQTATAMVLGARDEELRWVLDADIKECFDNIEPGLLMQLVRRHMTDKRLLSLIESWLHARILAADGSVRAAGAAQGGVLSPLLCNIYLNEFDVAMVDQSWRLVRYADDFVVLCQRRKQAEQARATAERALAQLRLQLNTHRTRIVSFDDGFKFLGTFFLRQEHFAL